MLETDCPFLAPTPYRGKRCEPAYVKDIAEAADCKVHLFLFVKVREDWANDPARYREMGLEFPKD